jgi:hypothetical protein
MSTFSGIDLSNPYSFPSSSLQRNSQTADSSKPTETPNNTNLTSSMTPQDMVQLSHLQTEEMSLSLLKPNYSPSSESLILSSYGKFAIY